MGLILLWTLQENQEELMNMFYRTIHLRLLPSQTAQSKDFKKRSNPYLSLILHYIYVHTVSSMLKVYIKFIYGTHRAILSFQHQLWRISIQFTECSKPVRVHSKHKSCAYQISKSSLKIVSCLIPRSGRTMRRTMSYPFQCKDAFLIRYN